MRAIRDAKLRFKLGFALFSSAAVLLTPGVAQADPGDNAASDDVVSVQAPSLPEEVAASNGIDPAGYWTEAKMRAAIPVDESSTPGAEDSASSAAKDTTAEAPENSVLSHPVAARDATQPAVDVSVPSTAGKLFFSYDGRDYVCSGSAVNSPNKSLVVTAGHCVNQGDGKGWHSNIAFAPAYDNGPSQYGLWNWSRATSFRGWTQNGDFSRDQAFITVHPRDGRTLVDTVGGNGLGIGYSHAQSDVRIWGWPAEGQYDGKVPHRCDGDTSRYVRPSDMQMDCPMTGGASGGPWLAKRSTEEHNYVFGVTSRRTLIGTPRLLSTPFDSAVADLFRGAGS